MENGKDKLSKANLAGDVGAGISGALIGALMSPFFNRQKGMAFTSQIGQALYDNRAKITAPLISSLSKDDESMYTSIELLMTSKNGNKYKDAVTQLLKAMGFPASNRFRSIIIKLPNPQKSDAKRVSNASGTTEELHEHPVEYTATDLRVTYLKDVIDDVFRFSGADAVKDPPDYTKGIKTVLENLKVRNIADADSVASEISRWWNEASPRDILSWFDSEKANAALAQLIADNDKTEAELRTGPAEDHPSLIRWLLRKSQFGAYQTQYTPPCLIRWLLCKMQFGANQTHYTPPWRRGKSNKS